MRLSDVKNNAPIPYRESKLTRLLQPALEGDSKVSIICNISSCGDAYDETLSTLKFAQRAKKIKQTIIKNDVVDSKALIIKYQSEIQELQDRLKEMENRMMQEESSLNTSTVNEQLILLQEEKEKADSRLESILQEKLQLQQDLERLKSFIICADDVKPPKVFTFGTETKEENELSLKIPLTRRLTYGGKNLLLFSSGQNSPLEIKNDEYGFDKKESLLIKDIDNIEQELDNEDSSEYLPIINYENITIEECKKIIEQQASKIEHMRKKTKERDNLLAIIQEQENFIEAMKKTIEEKDDAYELLNDELKLCRNNLSRMQIVMKMKTAK